MANVKDIKTIPPRNRLIGDMPKIGIRPTIDGRRQGVRESLEDQTMAMAKSTAVRHRGYLHRWCGRGGPDC
jgi:L-fucose isomerase